MPKSVMLSIGDIAARTGLAVSAIRYYEDEGLVAPERNAGGQRRYIRADIRRLSFVMAAQRFGFKINEIRALLQKLPAGRTPTKKDWAKISRGFRRELDTRISELTKLRDNLDRCIGCGCLSLQRCRLVNPNDEVGQEGPGPRFVFEV